MQQAPTLYTLQIHLYITQQQITTIICTYFTNFIPISRHNYPQDIVKIILITVVLTLHIVCAV